MLAIAVRVFAEFQQSCRCLRLRVQCVLQEELELGLLRVGCVCKENLQSCLALLDAEGVGLGVAN